MTMPATHERVWVLTDGSIGMENQGLAVAEALALPFECKRVVRSGPLRFLPGDLQALLPPSRLLRQVTGESDWLAPPWPDLVISIGRQSAPLALAIKRSARGTTFAVHIQDPKLNPALFDIVAAPLHDSLRGANVVQTLGAPHRVTAERLAETASQWRSEYDECRPPRVAVLIGGASRAFRFSARDAANLGRALAVFSRDNNASLLVTPSRRTDPRHVAIIAEQLSNRPAIIWAGRGDNPYFAYLAKADAIIVTEDSVNMVTEAAGTGKPIYVYSMRGGSRRLSRFHEAMRHHGATRPFDGQLASWSYAPVNDTDKIVQAVWRVLVAHLAPVV